MGLKNAKVKTTFTSIYEYQTVYGGKNYFARITKGKNIGWVNMTNKYACTTAKQAYDRLQEIQLQITKNKDPLYLKGEILDKLYYKYNKKLNEPYQTTTYLQYNKWVHEKIGHIKISKITVEDLEAIMDNIESKGIGNSTKEGVKNLLMPIFNREFELENINRNPLKLVKTNYKREKPFLNSTRDELIEIVKNVYKGIRTKAHGGINTEALFLLSLLTGRRIGELTQLKYTDINFDTKRIKVRAETTKTKKDNKHLYQYPLPEVVIELLIDNKDLDENIFPSHKDTYIRNYKVMITALKLGTDYKISSHTNRKFFISLCTKFDSDFVNEVVLSHTSNETKSVYLTYNYEDIKELFEYYWAVIKNEIS